VTEAESGVPVQPQLKIHPLREGGAMSTDEEESADQFENLWMLKSYDRQVMIVR
jgi:hypothetical protein